MKKRKNVYDIEKALYHVCFHHADADGFIAVAKKTEDGKFKQYHYRVDELKDQLAHWMGEDVYFSQNTFYKPQRTVENIRQLRSLYVDLDFYTLDYKPSWVLAKLEYEFFHELIPDPNIIIFSGRGMVLIWLLEPVPYQALPLWQAVQAYLVNTLSELGSDPKASDAARVFRIAGSINSKNGAEVDAAYRHSHKYELRQIQFDYLPELKKKKVVHATVSKKREKRAKMFQLFTVQRLHYTRVKDLEKVVELRQYDVTGHREVICFLYRYWMCCYTSEPVDSLQQTLLLNSQFTEPLSEKEVEQATKSAELAYRARSNKEASKIAKKKGYPGAGYNLKNTTIIDWLEITEDEMKQLLTIIDGDEKVRRRRHRDKLAKRKMRGSVSQEEYDERRKKQRQEKMDVIRQVLETLPKASVPQIAEMTGLTQSSIYRLLKLF